MRDTAARQAQAGGRERGAARRSRQRRLERARARATKARQRPIGPCRQRQRPACRVHVAAHLAQRSLRRRAALTIGARRGITAAAGEQSPARAQRVATGGTDGVAHRHSPAVATMELEAIDEPCVG